MKNSLEEYRKKFEKCQKVFDPTGDHAICALCGCSPELIDHTYSQAVQDFAKWLNENGYVDDDVWAEMPSAIDRFLPPDDENRQGN